MCWPGHWTVPNDLSSRASGSGKDRIRSRCPRISSSVAIARSVFDRPVDPIAPGAVPVFRNTTFVGRVVLEFREFGIAAIQPDAIYCRFPNHLVRKPAFRDL